MRSQAGQPRLFAPYYSAGRWRQQFLVAALSRGAAGTYWESLKRKENFRDKSRQETEHRSKTKCLKRLATPTGFEPVTLSLEV
jgi:hypothetical protein